MEANTAHRYFSPANELNNRVLLAEAYNCIYQVGMGCALQLHLQFQLPSGNGLRVTITPTPLATRWEWVARYNYTYNLSYQVGMGCALQLHLQFQLPGGKGLRATGLLLLMQLEFPARKILFLYCCLYSTKIAAKSCRYSSIYPAIFPFF